jgi:hypothetical protein
MARRPALPRLPFRNFLDHGEVTDFVQRLAAARPELCRLESLGPSREGRPIHLLTITDHTTGDAEDRPAYLIHANIHASEVAGTHMALYTARELLTDRSDLLQRVVFYIVPRLNPDGAEYAVSTGGAIRSRNDDGDRAQNTLCPEDVDGDGLILTMRQTHSDGAFIRDPGDPRLMIRRQSDSAGPFYRLLPEGLIEAWDGGDDIRQRRRSFDWNRNWSYDWRPEPEQGGAGDFPFSEPEMRHLGEFMHRRPNLFGVLGYHTGPAAVLRPPSTGADSDLDQGDLKIMEELARLGAEATGFPVVPVVKYHRHWQRDNNLRGHFHNFGYHHLGLYVFEFELGTAHDSAGIDTQAQFSVFTEDEAEAQTRRVMSWWDHTKRQHPLFHPWRKFEHPQLGPVEIGGFLVCGMANQTLDELHRIARGTHAFTITHALRHPRIVIEDSTVEAVGGSVYRVRARVANRGHLPTNVTAKGRQLRRLRTVRVEFHTEGCQLLSQRGHHDLGHLPGVTGSQPLEWFVKAGNGRRPLGEVRVSGGTAGNCRWQVERPAAR